MIIDSRRLGLSVDPMLLKKVGDILQLLARAVTAVKLYPSDHSNIQKYALTLMEKFMPFLEDNQTLDLGIEEFRFTFRGQPVFEDTSPLKSLPFLFFKDGMKSLAFQQGLDGQELNEFLEVIKTVSHLPADEADIVNALWEKDFPNIRYYAPDEFLETRISSGEKSKDVLSLTRKEDLFAGHIEMLPEDREELERSRQTGGEASPESGSKDSSFPDLPLLISQLDEKEMSSLEKILQNQRNVPPADELVDVIVEVVFLEDRQENFQALGESLKDCHQELIRRGHFAQARILIDRVREMKEFFSRTFPPKTEVLDRFLKQLTSVPNMREVKETVLQFQGTIDLDGAFLYLSALVPDSFQIMSDLFESTDDALFRQRTLNLLKETGDLDLKNVAPLAVDSRPVLSKQIIGLISRSRDPKAVSYLSAFLRSSLKEIRLEAIRMLGLKDNPKARLILMKTLGDEDADIRMTAASSLHIGDDRILVDQLIQLVSSKDFKKKNILEKKAILILIGESRNTEAHDFLRSLLLKRKFAGGRRHLETRLCAASALERMASPEAVQTLEEGSRRRQRKIRAACLDALGSLSQKGGPSSATRIKTP